MLIQFLVRDDSLLSGWQSGLSTAEGVAKPAYDTFRLPLTQSSRSGLRTVVWGQVRPGTGAQPYRLQQLRGGHWYWVGSTHVTTRAGLLLGGRPRGQGLTTPDLVRERDELQQDAHDPLRRRPGAGVIVPAPTANVVRGLGSV
jgi:hypothetical protein